MAPTTSAADPGNERAVATAAPPAVTAAASERKRRREVSTQLVTVESAQLFKDVLRGGVLTRELASIMLISPSCLRLGPNKEVPASLRPDFLVP